MTQQARESAAGPGGRVPPIVGGWRDRLRKRLTDLSACLMTIALLGCSAAAPPPPTVVELAVQPAADLNPDASGRPSPAVMRIYHLASSTAFETADFFQLYEDDAATLGADLLGRDESVVLPGKAQTLVLHLEPDVRFLGVAVFFRKFEGAEWRAVAPVPPNRTTTLNASLGALSVSLAPGGGQP